MILKVEDVIKLVSSWWVLYFKNKSYEQEAPSHYYISVPIKDDSCLLLCIITSFSAILVKITVFPG